MFQQIFANLNWFHIGVAAVAYFILGAIWYSPLFSKLWIKGHRINMEDPELKKGVAGIMIICFVLLFVVCTSLSVAYSFISVTDAVSAVQFGAFFGFGFAFSTTSISYLYLKKPISVHLIDGFYHVVGMIVASLILVLWK